MKLMAIKLSLLTFFLLALLAGFNRHAVLAKEKNADPVVTNSNDASPSATPNPTPSPVATPSGQSQPTATGAASVQNNSSNDSGNQNRQQSESQANNSSRPGEKKDEQKSDSLDSSPANPPVISLVTENKPAPAPEKKSPAQKIISSIINPPLGLITHFLPAQYYASSGLPQSVNMVLLTMAVALIIYGLINLRPLV